MQSVHKRKAFFVECQCAMLNAILSFHVTSLTISVDRFKYLKRKQVDELYSGKLSCATSRQVNAIFPL